MSESSEAQSSNSSSSSSSSNSSSNTPDLSECRLLAQRARSASRTLRSLGYPIRRSILRSLADALTNPANVQQLLEANAKDVELAGATGLSTASLARLRLTPSKLQSLSSGLAQLANPCFVSDPVDQLLRETLLADKLVLQQRAVPLGVLLVIFESRPDVLPQLVGLSVLSSNGLLLKGGKESTHTLRVLYSLCCAAITSGSEGRVRGNELVVLLAGREEVSSLLKLDDCIDLVIPRGSNQLVAHVKSHTRIPVLGHADGVCHVYLDEEYGGPTNLSSMIDVIIDSKCDYPAACNAAETLLMHEALLTHPPALEVRKTNAEGNSNGNSGNNGAGKDNGSSTSKGTNESLYTRASSTQLASAAHSVIASLTAAGVKLLVGPRALEHARSHGPSSPFHGFPPAIDLHSEYGDLRMCVEIVPDLSAAIDHIHSYGSAHTDAILTSSKTSSECFLAEVDSACVFHNASTRFADGFRMGLGAEVGISTSRIHARGPVGVEGLMTTKWSIRSEKPEGQTLIPFHKGTIQFIHKSISPMARL